MSIEISAWVLTVILDQQFLSSVFFFCINLKLKSFCIWSWRNVKLTFDLVRLSIRLKKYECQHSFALSFLFIQDRNLMNAKFLWNVLNIVSYSLYFTSNAFKRCCKHLFGAILVSFDCIIFLDDNYPLPIIWLLMYTLISAKIPFPLTQRFRGMLQNGIDLSTVDVSYVSSRSWCVLWHQWFFCDIS